MICKCGKLFLDKFFFRSKCFFILFFMFLVILMYVFYGNIFRNNCVLKLFYLINLKNLDKKLIVLFDVKLWIMSWFV